ncbi:unnamed protein product [Effrenium voratum]|uniref:Uncharacterized protein n=1 Tax=Effrenium voratum TaxID=2562239 RepID=A0AA36NIW6_9DINO|nr:unnamed protein product [Effrenium voratum]
MGSSLGRCACAICGADTPKRERTASSLQAEQAVERSHENHPAASRSSSWLAPVCLYLLLELLSRLGLPVLASPRLWAALCILFFWAWYSVEPSQPAQKWSPPEDASAEGLGEFLENLATQLDSRTPPEDPTSLRADGWKNISTKGARIFMKMLKVPKMTTQVYLNINSSDQEKYFPWFLMSGNTVKGGAIPIFLALEHWPSWFPFCQRVEKLKQLGTNQAIYLVRYKITFLTVDVVLLAALVDNLHKGKVELLFATPPARCKKWMGITVPSRTASFRFVLQGMRLSVRPKTSCSGQVVLQAETLDEVQFAWATTIFWQACASRIIGLIASMQSRFEGSVLEAHYRGDTKEAEAQRRQFLEVKAHLDSFCSQR